MLKFVYFILVLYIVAFADDCISSPPSISDSGILIYKFPNKENVTLEILDVFGNTKYFQNFDYTDDIFKFHILKLKTGIYIFRVCGSQEKKSYSFNVF